MRELRIAYRSFGVRREVIRRIPQKWEELTPDQFLLVSRFYLQESDESSFLKEFYSLPSGVGSDSRFCSISGFCLLNKPFFRPAGRTIYSLSFK